MRCHFVCKYSGDWNVVTQVFDPVICISLVKVVVVRTNQPKQRMFMFSSNLFVRINDSRMMTLDKSGGNHVRSFSFPLRRIWVARDVLCNATDMSCVSHENPESMLRRSSHEWSRDSDFMKVTWPRLVWQRTWHAMIPTTYLPDERSRSCPARTEHPGKQKLGGTARFSTSQHPSSYDNHTLVPTSWCRSMMNMIFMEKKERKNPRPRHVW